jgi:hypothetical protein
LRKKVDAIDYRRQLIREERENVSEANNNNVITKVQPFQLKENNRNLSNISIKLILALTYLKKKILRTS